MSTSPLRISQNIASPQVQKSGSFVVNDIKSSNGSFNPQFIFHQYSRSFNAQPRSVILEGRDAENIVSPRSFVIDEAHYQDLDYIHNKLTVFQKEIERLNKVNSNLEKEIDQNKFLLTQYGQREIELQPKLSALMSENDRLNRALQELNNLKIPAENRIRELSLEVQEWRTKALDFEPERNLLLAQLKNLGEEKDRIKANEFITFTENQVLKERLVALAGDLSSARKDLQREIEQNYTDILKKKSRELEELRSQITDLQETNSNQSFQINNLSLENARIKEANSRLQARVSNFERDSLELKKQCSVLQVKCEELTIQNNMYESDLTTISTILNSRTSDLGEAKRQLDTYREKLDSVSASREILLDETIRLRRSADLDKFDSDKKVINFDIKAKKLQDENEELKRRLTTLDHVNNLRVELETQIKNLIRENGQLKEQISQINRDSTLSSRKPNNVQYNIEFEDMKFKFSNLSQENARLQAELSKKTMELEAMKSQVSQAQVDVNVAMNRVKNSEDEIAQLRADLANQENRNNKLKADNNDLNQQIGALSNENMKIADMNQEIMGENTRLIQRLGELEGGTEVMNRLSMSMDGLVGENQKLKGELIAMGQKNSNLLEDNKNLFEALNELKTLNEKNRKDLIDQKNVNLTLQNENVMLRGIVNDLQNEKEAMNQRVRDKIKNIMFTMDDK
jgi:chromosome segregation ATPase